MDVSSEMIHALLPIYLVTVLGTSALTVGVIEGIAEATASITKVFSGALSDWLGRRKLLAAIGYGLAAFTKPVFPLATSIGWLVAARFIDRVGKGIRGAPRDALIADMRRSTLRGASFGLRQSLDTVGAFLGPLLAIAIMAMTTDNFTIVFWMAVLPAFLSFALIAFAVREPERPAGLRRCERRSACVNLRRLGGAYWWVVAVAGVFTLARFSEAFLILKAQAVGLPLALIPGVLVVMNVVYAARRLPGRRALRPGRSDHRPVHRPRRFWSPPISRWRSRPGLPRPLGVALWGLHMGFTQGLFATLVADAAPADLRGTAFGVFNLVTGVAVLAASVIAGVLWDGVGAAGTFLAGAAFTALAIAGLLVVRGRLTTARNALPD